MPNVKLKPQRNTGWGPQDSPATSHWPPKAPHHGNPIKDNSPLHNTHEPSGSAGDACGLVKWRYFAAPDGSSISSTRINHTPPAQLIWRGAGRPPTPTGALLQLLGTDFYSPPGSLGHGPNTTKTFFSFLNVLPGGLASLPQDGY